MQLTRSSRLALPLLLALCACATIAAGNQHHQQSSAHHPDVNAAYKDFPQQHAAQHEWSIGNRQGALIGHPFATFLPLVFLIGLGAIILIPLVILLFSPMGGGSYGAYGRKRSLTDDFFRKNLMDLVVEFSDAIEKYGGSLFEKAGKKP